MKAELLNYSTYRKNMFIKSEHLSVIDHLMVQESLHYLCCIDNSSSCGCILPFKRYEFIPVAQIAML